MTAFIAGAAYFLIVFAIGFLLGTIRVLFLAPSFGEVGAVLIETPIILSAGWVVCGYLIRRLNVAADIPNRLVMGVSAFALLISAETLLGVTGFGRTLGDIFTQYATPAGAIGLAAQLVFAAFPLLRDRGRG